MFCNLRAEMARRGITSSDLAKATHKTERCMRDKLAGRSEFTLPEIISIRKTFFSGLALEYLFDRSENQDAG